MQHTSFINKLEAAMELNNSLLCVGLDPIKSPLFSFNKTVIDQTHDVVCAFKPNSAFFEAFGVEGITELKKTIEYIHTTYPQIPVILDAKRGDIGNTNKGYARFAFEYLQADALTVIPYMGIEALDAYFEYRDKGIIVGCHSSNAGAQEFQELTVNDEPLYHVVAKNLIKKHGSNPNAMIFMGATYAQELVAVRKIVGEMTMLVPGVGAQGGDVKTFVEAGKNSLGKGLVINASRSIIFAQTPRDEATKLRDEINQYR